MRSQGAKSKPRNNRRLAPRQEQGAKASKSAWQSRLQGYLTHHRSSARDSLGRLMATPLQSLMTWMMIAVAMTLPAALLVSLDNLEALGQQWDGAAGITVFINPRAKPTAIENFRQQLETNTEVAQIVYRSPEQALQEFEQQSGMGRALRELDGNPLPPSLLVQPLSSLAPDRVVALGESIGANPLVDDVVYDQAWIERLHRILALGKQLALLLGALLALGVWLVISNTIRLAIESRRQEVIIIKLVGGSNAFVRRPFLYTGIWYGIGGALLALLLLSVLLGLLSGTVMNLASSYQSDFNLQGLSLGQSGVLLLVGIAIGWLGAWLAVSRHLSAIEPK